MSGENVEVGFTDKLNNPLLFAPEHFPSKVGGHPAWLNPSNLPPVAHCGQCGDPLTFFSQIYAGLDRESNGFHRMLYVFCCRRGSCYVDGKQPIKVFRSQLPAENQYYRCQPVPEGDADENSIGENKSFALSHNGFCDICKVCGSKAPFKCIKCQSAHYCSKQHQKYDWKQHKSCCSDEYTKVPNKPEYLDKSALLFAELDFIIEREPEQENAAHLNEELLKKVAEQATGYAMTEEDAESLSKEYGKDTDPTFTKFKERISRDPSQVLRYSRHDTPLWPSSKLQCDTPPPCKVCGAARSFEVQFLPSILYILGVKKEELDWATLAIFTCSKDCEVDDYVEEYGWVQQFS